MSSFCTFSLSLSLFHYSVLLPSFAHLFPSQFQNDLDSETIRSLENSLLDFGGSALVVSHDRYFLDKICTHILAFEGDSKVHMFNGNWAEYDEDRKKRLGDVDIKRVTFAALA